MGGRALCRTFFQGEDAYGLAIQGVGGDGALAGLGRCGRLPAGAWTGEVGVGVVAVVLRVRLRQHWRSWLALAALVALVGGFVMAAAATGRRTAAAFPGFVARHGYDAVVYSGRPLPGLARIPRVALVTPVFAPWAFPGRCASCRAASRRTRARRVPFGTMRASLTARHAPGLASSPES